MIMLTFLRKKVYELLPSQQNNHTNMCFYTKMEQAFAQTTRVNFWRVLKAFQNQIFHMINSIIYNVSISNMAIFFFILL